MDDAVGSSPRRTGGEAWSELGCFVREKLLAIFATDEVVA